MADILQMNWWQIQAYINAHEYDRNERLVVLMNVMAVAFGGSAKERRNFTSQLLGTGQTDFDIDAFENVFANLADPIEVEAQDEAKQWAAGEFDANDPAFKVT